MRPIDCSHFGACCSCTRWTTTSCTRLSPSTLATTLWSGASLMCVLWCVWRTVSSHAVTCACVLRPWCVAGSVLLLLLNKDNTECLVESTALMTCFNSAGTSPEGSCTVVVVLRLMRTLRIVQFSCIMTVLPVIANVAQSPRCASVAWAPSLDCSIC